MRSSLRTPEPRTQSSFLPDDVEIPLHCRYRYTSTSTALHGAKKLLTFLGAVCVRFFTFVCVGAFWVVWWGLGLLRWCWWGRQSCFQVRRYRIIKIIGRKGVWGLGEERENGERRSERERPKCIYHRRPPSVLSLASKPT